jgi:hypothetical protein
LLGVSALAAPGIRLAQPPPAQYHLEQLWNLQLSNPDAQSYDVWLEGAIYEADGDEAFWAASNHLTLNPGSMNLRYGQISVRQQRHAPGYEQFAARTGGLPEGSYTFVVTLMPFGVSDSGRVTVRPPGAIRLLSPREGDSVAVQHPRLSWSPLPQPPHHYQLTVAEVLANQTPEDALRAVPPWFQSEHLSATSLRYPVSARALMPGHRYAWQVQALGQTGNVVSTSAAGSFLFNWGRPGEGGSKAWEEVLKKLAGLLPGIWKTIAKQGITIAGAVGRYIANEAWAAMVNQWQGLTQENPGQLITPAPNTWPNIRIIGVEQGGRSYLIVIVLGEGGTARDVYILPCPFSTGFGEFGLTVGSRTTGWIFKTAISEFTIRNNDLVRITDLTYEFDRAPGSWDEPGGWDSENPGGDDKKVRFFADDGGILPGQSQRFDIKRGGARLLSITASYKAADGTEKQGYTMRF